MSGGVLGLPLPASRCRSARRSGFIALLGQVCLASLLVVSAVEQRRRAGEDLLPALAAGAASRFRTVLMTALLAILGLMPAALSAGVGSETQRPFAVVIISGLDHGRGGDAVRPALCLQLHRPSAPDDRDRHRE